MATAPNFSKDFREFVESLNANSVRYLIVGGYAVAFHGHPRYTKDLDVWIELAQDNAERLVKALDQFGFASLGLKADDFLAPGQFVQLGVPPNRIDVMTAASGVDFVECFSRRVVFEIDGVPTNFIDLEGLKTNKLASGRLQDRADLENLT